AHDPAVLDQPRPGIGGPSVQSDHPGPGPTIDGSLRVVRMFLAFPLPSVAGRAMLNGTRVVTISQNGLHRDPGRDRSSG
ncbi:MAG: hypothetical protein ACXWN0_16635, partial [Isosphaeraceae bacterium]